MNIIARAREGAKKMRGKACEVWKFLSLQALQQTHLWLFLSTLGYRASAQKHHHKKLRHGNISQRFLSRIRADNLIPFQRAHHWLSLSIWLSVIRLTAKISHRKVIAAFFVGAIFGTSPVQSETLLGALAKAYQNNATLNSSRADVRITDEGVALAKSGYRPQIIGTVDYTRAREDGRGDSAATGTAVTKTTNTAAISINQPLFDGFQTNNNVSAAKNSVYAARQNLRKSEQDILLSAVSAYITVYQNRQIVVSYERNLAFLNEQVRATRARLDVGETTRTDVSQAEAERARALASLNQARADLKTSEAVYRQVIGVNPGKLDAAIAASKLLPHSIEEAYNLATTTHPNILASKYAMDAAQYNVKAKEGALLPMISLNASAQHTKTFDVSSSGYPTDLPYSYLQPAPTGSNSNAASIGIKLSIPFYNRGQDSAQIRQLKEQAGKARIDIDIAQDSVRASVVAAWGQLDASRASVLANRAYVSASKLALKGVIEERNVGQRMMFDVLQAQYALVNAQVALTQAECNAVVVSYKLLSAVGRLTVDQLGLQVAQYRPETHYEAVKNKWIGLRTP